MGLDQLTDKGGEAFAADVTVISANEATPLGRGGFEGVIIAHPGNTVSIFLGTEFYQPVEMAAGAERPLSTSSLATWFFKAAAANQKVILVGGV